MWGMGRMGGRLVPGEGRVACECECVRYVHVYSPKLGTAQNKRLKLSDNRNETFDTLLYIHNMLNYSIYTVCILK